jgi:N-acetylmuramoyl-L-alanine amidase
MTTRIVGIDAGHGGSAPGAVARDGVTREKDLNLAVARSIASQANIPNIVTSLIRREDEKLSLYQRNARARHIGCDLVVSCHFDSLPARSTAHGLSAYYHRGNSATRSVAEWLVRHSPLPLRGGRVVCAHDDPSRTDDDWLENPEAIVTAYSASVLLIEFAFLSNERDLDFVLSSRAIDMCAWSAIMALHRYAIISA